MKCFYLLAILFAIGYQLSYSQIKVMSTGNVGIGDISDPAGYKLWLQNGNYKLLTGGSTDGTGCNLLRLYNNQGIGFSINSYENTTAYNNLITEIGINYTVNGSTGTNRYTALGSKKSPIIKFDAENGSISLYGENGSGSDWRGPILNLGITINSTGYVGIGEHNDASYPLDVWGDINATGNVRSYGNIIYSDIKIKTDIQDLNHGNLEKLHIIKAVTFKYKLPEQFTEQTKLETDSSGTKSNPDTAVINSELYRQTQIGLIAQEVQKVYPELVTQDKDGILAIKYSGLIPVLIDAINEIDSLRILQEVKINDLEARVSVLESSLNFSGAKKSASSSDTENSVNADVPTLSQNAPNPFNRETRISYYLPEFITQASITIYNLNGNAFKNIILSGTGKGVISIDGSELKPGIYLYSLITNGKEVDTKRMILTE